MSTTVRIVESPDVLHGKPRVKGTRVGVLEVGEFVHRHGQSVEDVVQEFDLDRAKAEAALEYYEDPRAGGDAPSPARDSSSGDPLAEPPARVMRICCDQNVASKYVLAFERAEGCHGPPRRGHLCIRRSGRRDRRLRVPNRLGDLHE
ncbi:DUF433 domain-containing protein [Salinarchaeum laminariae]|uniref:DUF433 domain-containing protein n=1 Tax=Salinarchaeum laminariae TaxID=869888 RepID=UPI0035BEE86F